VHVQVSLAKLRVLQHRLQPRLWLLLAAAQSVQRVCSYRRRQPRLCKTRQQWACYRAVKPSQSRTAHSHKVQHSTA
jgi:hypothetical protein